jgi:hypothetical protein
MNKRLIKQLDTKKEQEITKQEERIFEKCGKCGNVGVNPCTLKQYMDFVGAEPVKCPNSAYL